MKFWDTSAIVPLCVVEPASTAVRAQLEADPGMVVWWGTRTECVSAIARQRRAGQLDADGEHQARAVLSALAASWAEVLPSEPLRARCERLLTVHALRAADAWQLAAALLWARGETVGRAMLCFDERLRDAGRREGFDVRPT